MATPQGTVWLIGIKVGTESASYNADGNREYEAVYIVNTSSGRIAAPNVVLAAGLPRLKGRYLHDYAARCKAIDPQRVANSQTLWHVRCRWEVKVGEDPDREGLKPWEWPPEVSWGEVPFEVFPTTDLDGNPFENTAGMAFDPPPSIPQSNQLLTIVHNEIGFSPHDATVWGNTVNDRGWFGYPMYAVKLSMPTAVGKWHEGEFYSEVVYRLEIMCGHFWNEQKKQAERRLWIPYDVPNVGPMAIPEGGGEPVRVVDGYNDPIGTHQKLDNDGHQMAHDAPMMYVPFRRFETANFANYFHWL